MEIKAIKTWHLFILGGEYTSDTQIQKQSTFQIPLINQNERKNNFLSIQASLCALHISIALPIFVFLSYWIWTHTAWGGKKNLCMLLTSKQVYKLIQRAVILKIFYV